ncbi:DUF5681 domain-containing protein [Chryseolinea sp. T2]|uniref:DUF5681 domain-containing protein n=1 Tax=Chryseolinea sp. T2 TaxID=3129255 RepID=UPI003077517C
MIAKKGTNTRFKPGQSGNPLGRPKRLPSLDRALVDVLGKVDKHDVTVLQRIVEALARKAMRGDIRAAELLLDRGFGKAKATLGVTVEGEITQFLRMTPEEKLAYIKKLECDE